MSNNLDWTGSGKMKCVRHFGVALYVHPIFGSLAALQY